MADPLASAQKLRKAEGSLQDFLLESRKRLRAYPSPNGFDRAKEYELRRSFLKSNPDMPKKELNAKIKESLIGLRIAYAEDMIKFIEEVLFVLQVVQSNQADMSRNIIPGVIDSSTTYHISKIKADLIKLEKPLMAYLAYWKWIQKKGRFPLFSKYNAKYPHRFIDEMIAKDQKIIDFTWRIISKLSDAHTFTTVRKRN